MPQDIEYTTTELASESMTSSEENSFNSEIPDQSEIPSTTEAIEPLETTTTTEFEG